MVSTTAVMDTQFTEQFNNFLQSETDAKLKQLRESAFAAFTELGFPTPKDEDWKYTDVRRIANTPWTVFPTSILPDNESAQNLDRLKAFGSGRNGFTALNVSFAQFLVVVIPKDVSFSEPITLDFGARNGAMTCPHVLIVAESGCKVTIIESYKSNSSSFINSAVQVFVGDNANVTHYRIQKDDVESYHYGVTEVNIGRGSRYDSTNINLGGAISRHDIDVKFTAEGGEAWVDGLYMLSGSQHSDTHSIIDHTVPNCTSHQDY